MSAVRVHDDSGLDLTPFVPDLVARWGAGAGAADHRVVPGTLVSADISGFTKLSENLARLGREGAEELTDLLNGCFTAMIDVADEHGGDVLKFGGDALLVLYTGEGHTERAALAALGMRATVDAPLTTSRGARVRLRMSVGIHRGEFAFFMLEGAHRELVVSGPAATQTVVCEGEAAAGQILLSEAAAASLPPRWLGARHPHGRLLRRVIDLATEVIDLRTPHAADDLGRYVPAAQREAIATGMPGEHRRVTTAFVKFSGTDDLVDSEGPGALASRLAELAGSVAAATEQYGVHWLGSDIYPDGGKIILAAGAPTSAGDDEERMVRALQDVLRASPLVLRAGVNCGPVFAGLVGATQRRTFTVMGDAVNLAARLMQKAEAGQLVASRAVLDRVSSPVRSEALEPFLVKGKSQPIQAAVVQEVGVQPAVDAHEAGELPFVGRVAEMRAIAAAFDVARRGTGRIVEVVAGPGVGKTRLLDAVREAHPDFTVVAVRCGQYAQGTPYFAARSLLRQLADIPHEADADAAGRQLQTWVASVAPDLLPWLPLLAIPADAAVAPTPEADRIGESFKRQRIHQTVAGVLASVVHRPYLIAIEDAHWIDDASEALIRDLLPVASAAPVVAWIGHRPGDAPPWVTPDTGDRLELAPLDPDATAALVLGAGIDLTDDAVARVVERSGGNPLFVRELLAAGGAADVDALPESLESLVTARIDTLPAADRVLLRDASVLGTVVDLGVLAGASGRSPDAAPWERLAEFVEPIAGHQVRFRHAMHRQVAYEGLSFRQRRHMHRAVGLEIERRAGAKASENAALLSLHFAEGRDHERAWRYACTAADEARAKYATVEAGDLYQRALENGRGAGVATDDLLRVQEALGDVRELSARYAEASDAYGGARRLAADVGTRARLLRKEGELRERAGRFSEALRWYGRALGTLAELDPDDPAVASTVGLWLAYAGVRFRQGRYAECVRWAGEAAAEAERRGSRSELAHAYYLLDLGHYALGSGDLTYRGKALPLYEEAGDLVGEANVLNNLGMVAQYDGRFEEAIELYERSRSASQRAGDAVGAATASNNIGECLLGLGRDDEAVVAFERAARVWRAAPYPIGIALATSNLGHATARLGDLDEAERLLREAQASFDELKAVGFGLQAALRLADCAARRGDLDGARAQLAAVLAAIDEAGDRLFSGEREELSAGAEELAERLGEPVRTAVPS